MTQKNALVTSQPTLQWVVVSPEMARGYLSTVINTNRPVVMSHVTRLVADMKHGNWIVSTTPIKFDHQNKLIDGQHRLRAVLESGLTFPFLIAQNCHDMEFTVQDIGLKRSLADIEFMAQAGDVPHKVLKTRMAVANNIYRRGGSVGDKRSDTAKIAFYHTHAEPVTWAVDVAGAKHRGVPYSTVVLAVIARASYSADRHQLEAFVHQFRDGNAVSPDSPVLRLRDFFLQTDSSGRAGTIRLYQRAESALSAFLQKRDMKILRPVATELYPLPDEDAQQ